MDIKIATSFASDFKVLNDASLSDKVKSVLEQIKEAKSIAELSFFKEIQGGANAYKMRIGFYYLVGMMNSDTEIILLRFLHKDEVSKIISTL